MTTDRDAEAVKDETKTSTPSKKQIPTWRKRLYYAIGFFAMILFYCFMVLVDAMNMSGNYSDFEPIPIRIEKEITYFQEPLREEGIINYTAAVNQQASEGVSPENNVVVPLARIIGPNMFRHGFLPSAENDADELTVAYFKKLGIEFPNSEDEFFLSLAHYARQKEADSLATEEPFNFREFEDTWYDQFNEAIMRPWSRKEFPELAGWVVYNSRFQEQIESGLNRDQYYSPIVSIDSNGTYEGPLLWASHPINQHSRDLVDYLAVRATLALHEEKPELAIQFAVWARRLSSFNSKSYGFIDTMAAIASDRIAFDACIALIQSGELSIAQLESMRDQLALQGPLPVMADIIDFYERLVILDIFSRASFSDPHAIETMTNLKPGEQSGEKLVQLLRILDWNLMLKMVNERFDLEAEALRNSTYQERLAAKAELEKLADENRAKVAPFELLKGMLRLKIYDRQTISRLFAHMYIELMAPVSMSARGAEDRARTRMKLLEIVFALEIHRQQHGQFPDSLDSILPAMRPEQLQDIFTGEPYLYTSEGEGYLLYSVGLNLKDDGAQDYNAIPRKDDIVVRQGQNQPADLEPDSAMD